MTGINHWRFPLPRVHTGMLLGNSLLGVMVWGQADRLELTFGRSDLWDHRGGMAFRPAHHYQHIRELLEAGDQQGLRDLFAEDVIGAGTPRRPSVIPVGRLTVQLAGGWRPASGRVRFGRGRVVIALVRGRERSRMQLVVDPHQPVFALRCSDKIMAGVCSHPAWEQVGESLSQVGFDAPQVSDRTDDGGWVQPMPVDEDVTVAWRKSDRALFVAVTRGESEERAVSSLRDQKPARVDATIAGSASGWWSDYWQQVPRLDFDDSQLQFLYEYGMYKFGAATRPGSVACTLQGPWIEDYQLPPWSSDYHFNINVQMCYWPAYAGNRPGHLMPLFDLVDSWRDQMRHNAKMLVGIDDGLMLPHAVDDRCTCMGGFWTGVIDHACTAWVGRMMYDYWRYTGDVQFLRDRAWPMLHGAMRVYQAMLEKDGAGYRLPVSVSPEYRGSAMNAWGANASMQLAAIHMLIEALLTSAPVLGIQPDPEWLGIQAALPKASVDDHGLIELWQSTGLEASHRHHSHLAGICPFDVFDPADPGQRKMLRRSVRHWIGTGQGRWSGWSFPWAVMLHLRMGQSEAARLLIDIWQRVFTNQGHGTLHDVAFAGYSLTGDPPRAHEVMQLDAGLAMAAALLEMMVYHQRGVHYLFGGFSQAQPRASFRGIRGLGGFLISARRRKSQVRRVVVKATCDGVFRLANPWPVAMVQIDARRPERLDSEILELVMSAGQRAVLRSADR